MSKYNMKNKSIFLLVFFLITMLLQSCGIGGYHMMINKTQNNFPYSGKFNNTIGLNLAYRIRLPYQEYNNTKKMPLILYIDGSAPITLDMTIDNMLAHYQSLGFIAAAKQKRGVAPSEGNSAELTFEDRIQDNLDFIHYLLNKYPQIDSEQVYIMGHSEGATVAGPVASKYKNTAGLIWISAGFNEDFFDLIIPDSSESESANKIKNEIREGKNLEGKWRGHSKKWWYQHFNHSHIPELMNLQCPIIFLIGEKDAEFKSLQKRYKEMVTKGKKNISLFTISEVGHGTISAINQESLISTLDKWLEDIKKSNHLIQVTPKNGAPD